MDKFTQEYLARARRVLEGKLYEKIQEKESQRWISVLQGIYGNETKGER